jgi:nicotinate phosphoribosyltransferase
MQEVPFSLLDNDLYKFSMQQAVLKVYPQAIVSYEFKNRKPEQFKFTTETVSLLKQRISGTFRILI